MPPLRGGDSAPHADVAQLVERRLPKPKVAGSTPVVRFARKAARSSERAGSARVRAVFDHVLIAVTALAASERFSRTVLSALGAEPAHVDAEIVEWEDWDVLRTGPEHPVTRGL